MNEINQRKAPRVNLKPNIQKILAAITYVISIGEIKKIPITQYDILKALFLADKSHLNKYGRPITFDNYFAMKDGPVPSLSYDLLKENKARLKRLHLQSLPWDRKSGPGGIYYYSKANPIPYDGVLSESDKNAISDALQTIKSLTFTQIKRLTHADPAYIEAWDEGRNRRAYQMSYGMLFDAPDFEKAETIEFLSKYT